VGFMDKVKVTATAAKAVIEKRQQQAAEERRVAQEAAAAAAARAAKDRERAFAEAQRTSPLPLQADKTAVADGMELFNDEFVVSIARDWGWSSQRLTLTTHRVLWSKGVLKTDQKSLYLTDVRDVRYHKPLLGAASVILETAGGRSIEGLPAASNGAKVRDHLLAMIHWARQRSQQQQPSGSTATATQGPTRLEQLQQLAQLKEQGILSEAEFQSEKAKILSQPS